MLMNALIIMETVPMTVLIQWVVIIVSVLLDTSFSLTIITVKVSISNCAISVCGYIQIIT